MASRPSHVSASVDVETMVNDVFAAAQQTGAQTAQLPQNVQQQAADAVKKANFDVYVGKDDGLLRRAASRRRDHAGRTPSLLS